MPGRVLRRVRRMKPRALKDAIERLAETGCEVKAMVAGGFGRRVLNSILERRPAFKRAWEEAELRFNASVEQELIRRAKDGVVRHKFFQGKMIMVPGTDAAGKKIKVPYVEREFSDGLLIKLLEARMPDRYGPKSKVELTGADGAALIPVINVTIDGGN